MNFLRNNLSYMWFIFTLHWGRYAVLVGLIVLAFIWGRYGYPI